MRHKPLLGVLLSALFLMPANGQLSGQEAKPSSVKPRLIAEWEPAVGTLIAWPLKIPDRLVQELASDDELFMLVQPAFLQAAQQHLRSLNIPENVVTYIECPVESEWPRDWGPHQIFDINGNLFFVDHKFDGYPWYPRTGGKPQLTFRTGRGDDQVSLRIADALKRPLVECPAVLTGGNFLVDGHGTAFCTQALIDENKSDLEEEPLRQLLKERLGIERLIVLENTETVGIQHIDCWLKVLDPERLLVKRAPAGHPEAEVLERNASVLSRLSNAFDRPYEILRIDCPEVPVDRTYPQAKPVAAYTNSLILNKKVLVPLFGVPGDERAMQTWRKALPGYEIKGFVWDQWLDYDALHCRTRAVFDPQMLRIEHPRQPAEIPFSSDGYPIIATIEDTSRSGLDLSQSLVYFRVRGETDWRTVPLMQLHVQNKLVAVIPASPGGTNIEYYLTSRDLAGITAFHPAAAPASFHAFQIAD